MSGALIEDRPIQLLSEQDTPSPLTGIDAEWKSRSILREETLKSLIGKGPGQELQLRYKTFLKYIDSIDSNLNSLLVQRNQLSTFQERYSAIFDNLELSSSLNSPRGQKLISEFVELQRGVKGGETSFSESLERFKILRDELAPLMKQYCVNLQNKIEEKRTELVTILSETAPIVSIEQMIDLAKSPEAHHFAALRKDLKSLKRLVSRIDAEKELSQQFLTVVETIQSTVSSIDENITSGKYVLAGLNSIVRAFYPQLPPPAFQMTSDTESSHPKWNSELEKSAYLILCRHLDLLSGSSQILGDDQENAVSPNSQVDQAQFLASSTLDFFETAKQERDALFDELIKELDINAIYDLLMAQAKGLEESTPHIRELVSQFITEANIRIEEKSLEIAIEASLSEEIARFIARNKLSPTILKEIYRLFSENSELHETFLNMLRIHDYLPITPAGEFKEFIDVLKSVRESLAVTSPILLASFTKVPSESHVTLFGLQAFFDSIQNITKDPERLFNAERDALIGLTACLLKNDFPVHGKTEEQHQLAAQILVTAFMPERHFTTLKRVDRDSNAALKHFERALYKKLSFPIVYETINTFLVPHILTVVNGSETNPTLKKYHIRHDSDPKVAEVLTLLETLATHAPIKKVAAPTSTAKPVEKKKTASNAARKGSKRTPEEIELEKTHKELESTERSIAKLNLSLELLQSLDSYLERVITSDEAYQKALESMVSKVSNAKTLAPRLASSLANKMTLVERSKYRDPLELSCFDKLRSKAGLTLGNVQTKADKAASKKITSEIIENLVINQISFTDEDSLRILEDSKQLAELCKSVLSEILQKNGSANNQDLKTIRKHLEALSEGYGSDKVSQAKYLTKYYSAIESKLELQQLKVEAASLKLHLSDELKKTTQCLLELQAQLVQKQPTEVEAGNE